MGVWLVGNVGAGLWGPDYNGYGLTDVDNFRDASLVPCGFDVYQDMYMDCPGGVPWTW